MAKIYHRKESPTQTPEHVRLQVHSGELWGKSPLGSDIPAAQAYLGPLPSDCRGIEFTTDTEPDSGSPPGEAYWRGPRDGVEVAGDYAKIKIKVIRNTQV